MTVQNKVDALRQDLRAQFFERNGVIDGLLAAMLAGEHLLLLGPPGTAKSALARALCGAIDKATYYEWLLTRTTTPEEVLGPMSLSGLEEDRFYRVTDGKLPTAHVGFLDEVFKANSTILNSLLSVLQERIFHNNGAPTSCPLITCIGASNELPESAELEALFDRFVFRFWVEPLADRVNFRAMITATDPQCSATLTLKEIEQAKGEAMAVQFSDDALEVLLDVKDAIERAGVKASDRRWKRIIKVLKAYAYVCGDKAVDEDHFDVLPDLLWREPKERPAIVQEVGKIANPLAARAVEILDAAKEMSENLPLIDDAGKAAFLVAAAEANAEFDQMRKELQSMIKDHPGKRKLSDALDQVQVLHKKTQRAAAKAAGIPL